jgi:hypothetical protein
MRQFNQEVEANRISSPRYARDVACGFVDQSHIGHVFVRVVGSSPGAGDGCTRRNLEQASDQPFPRKVRVRRTVDMARECTGT